MVAKKTDHRAELFIAMTTASQSLNRKLLLWMRLCVFLTSFIVTLLTIWMAQAILDLVVKDLKVNQEPERAHGPEVALGVTNEPMESLTVTLSRAAGLCRTPTKFGSWPPQGPETL